jgi:hypothetical protein
MSLNALLASSCAALGEDNHPPLPTRELTMTDATRSRDS